MIIPTLMARNPPSPIAKATLFLPTRRTTRPKTPRTPSAGCKTRQHSHPPRAHGRIGVSARTGLGLCAETRPGRSHCYRVATALGHFSLLPLSLRLPVSLAPLPSFISVGQHVDGLQLDALRSCVCICRSRPRAHDPKPWERRETAVLCNASVSAQQRSLSGHVEQSPGEWEGPARGRGHTSDPATHAGSEAGRAESLIKKNPTGNG